MTTPVQSDVAPTRSDLPNAGQASIAVLPFVNISGDPEQDYLGDGITEEIISSLSRISALHVPSRDLVFSYRHRPVEPEDVVLRLGVQYLLRGSVKKVNDRVRIEAALTDGHTGRSILTERYDRRFEDIFDVMDAISSDVVEALQLSILPAERETLSQRPVSNSEAYRFYLMGRSYFHRGHTRRTLRLAQRMFQHALALDPDYAAAHAGYADCLSHLLDAGDFSISTEAILEHSDRAIAIDRTLAEAHASKGLALYMVGRYDEAEASFEHAIDLQPDLFEAYYFYGRNCFNLGNYGKAADLFSQAAKFKKDDFRALGLQSMCFQSLAQLGEARNAARSALARTEAAVAAHPDEADALSFGAGLLAFLGEYNRTRDWAERASVLEPGDFYTQYNVACAYALLGAKEEALDGLERIMDKQSLPSQQHYMMNDSDLDTLRDHPRYKALLARLGY